MAKDKKQKKPAKTKDAGTKLAKEIGKQAEKFVELAKHPLVSDIIAAGLVALAASVRDGKGEAKTNGKGKSARSQAGADFAKTAQGLAGALAAKAAEKVTSRLFDTPSATAADTASPTPSAAPAKARATRKPAAAKAKTTTPKRAAAAPAKPRATPRKPRTPKPTS